MFANEEESKGYIRDVRPDQVIIGITGFTRLSQLNFSIRPSELKFRGGTAPSHFININTEVTVKHRLNKIIEVKINNNLEYHAFFGIIRVIDPRNQIAYVSYGVYSGELNFSSLRDADDKKIPFNLITSLTNRPVIVILNSDSVLRARVLVRGWKQSFNLAPFSRNSQNQEETDFIVLNDNRLIPHKIPAEQVFYQGTEENLSQDQINYCVGAIVEVFVNESLAIQAFLRIRSNRINAVAPRFYTPNNQINNQDFNFRNFRTVNDQIIQNYGQRMNLRLNGRNLYYFENQYFQNIGIAVLALFEVCYRFPHLNLKEVLREQFLDAMQLYQGQGYQQILLETISKSRNSTIAGDIEELYKQVSTNIGVFEYFAKQIIGDPLDFAFISNKYEVYIYVLDSLNNWSTYLPFYSNNPMPIICFRLTDHLEIFYTEEMMKYDGYKLVDSSYCRPIEIDQNYLFENVVKAPNFGQMFKNFLALQQLVAKKDLSDENKIIKIFIEVHKSFNSISQTIPQEMVPECAEAYSTMLPFKFIQPIVMLCSCQKEADQNILCGDHCLCSECAFVSSRLGVCLTCGNEFLNHVAYRVVACPQCHGEYGEKYYSGFSCRCILCIQCIYSAIGNQSKKCFNGHLLQESDSTKSLSYMRSLNYEV